MQTVCSTYWDAGKGNLTAQNTRKPFGGRGSALDPAEGTYSAPANRLVGVEGLAVPSPRTPPPALGPSGLASSTPHSKISSGAHAYEYCTSAHWCATKIHTRNELQRTTQEIYLKKVDANFTNLGEGCHSSQLSQPVTWTCLPPTSARPSASQ